MVDAGGRIVDAVVAGDASVPSERAVMTSVVMSALGAALGLVGLLVAVRPRPQSLRTALARLDGRLDADDDGVVGAGPDGPGATGPVHSVPGRSALARLDKAIAARLVDVVAERDDVRAWLAPLLAVTETPLHEVLSESVLGAMVGSLLPITWWLVVAAGGVHVPFSLPLGAGLVLGVVGAMAPVLILRSRAVQARRRARRSVGTFLNLVVLCLAGGMGIEGALHAAAEIGDDAVARQIVTALGVARDSGVPPWDALDRLGRRLGVTELTELASAVGLAGAEGARIRLTLSAKASSIRRHELAEE
ncbi:MAG: type II secretion system F family protein, partial [Acidimicrobiales bacterium]